MVEVAEELKIPEETSPEESFEEAGDEEAEDEETEDEEAEAEAVRKMGVAFSPDAIIMFPLAIILDFAGLLLAIFGVTEIFSYVTDFIGLIFIGLWTYSHSQTVKVTYGAAARLTKVAKLARLTKVAKLARLTKVAKLARLTKVAKLARRMRWLRPLLIILEFVPIVGAAPCWTILVWFELQS